MRRRYRAATPLLAAALVAACVLAACSSSSSSAGHRAATSTTSTKGPAYAGPGPYAAGVTTLRLGDRSVEVWYPADPATVSGRPKDTYYIRRWLPPAIDRILPASANPPFQTDAYRDVAASPRGPFPLVLFSHGFAAYRDQSTFLTVHLAQWGFVVAAPDQLERGLASVLGQAPAHPMSDVAVLRATVDLLHTEDARAGLLQGRVRPGHFAVVGHSAGGADAITFGAQPDVIGYVAMSAAVEPRAGAAAVSAPRTPSLYLTGAADTVVPLTAIEKFYAAAPAPKRLVVLGRAGHLAFSDICAIGSGGGGVVAIAQKAGLPVPPNLVRLGTDGCQRGSLAPRAGWPVIDHYVTAQLRAWFRIDARPVGMGDAVAHDFDGVDVTYRHSP